MILRVSSITSENLWAFKN